MNDMIRVKPTDLKQLVRNPNRGMRPLTLAELVPASLYWERRLRAGDIVKVGDDEWKQIEAERAEKAAAEKAEAEKAKKEAAAADKPAAPLPAGETAPTR